MSLKLNKENRLCATTRDNSTAHLIPFLIEARNFRRKTAKTLYLACFIHRISQSHFTHNVKKLGERIYSLGEKKKQSLKGVFGLISVWCTTGFMGTIDHRISKTFITFHCAPFIFILPFQHIVLSCSFKQS